MTARSLVATTGELLRAVNESPRLVRLEVVRPNRRPKTWRVVPMEQVDRHAKLWAAQRGVTT